MRNPTLVAWGQDDGLLDEDDYRAVATLLLRADIEALLKVLGYSEEVGRLDQPERRSRVAHERRLMVDDRVIEPDFVAAVGYVGILPIRLPEDEDLLGFVRAVIGERLPDMALVSLSSEYVDAVVRDPQMAAIGRPSDTMETGDGADYRFAQRAGLTVAWLSPGDEVRFIG